MMRLRSMSPRLTSPLRNISSSSAYRARNPPVDPPLQTQAPGFAYTVESESPSEPSSKLPKVVLLHGGPGSHADFRYISGEFAALRGLDKDPLPTLIRVDLRGYGSSQPPLQTPSAANLASSLLDGLQASEEGDGHTSSYIFVGHSLGAHVALEAARQQPEVVAGLGFIAPVCFSHHYGLRPYFVNRFAGKNTEHFLLGPPIRKAIDFFYTQFGFPASIPLEEKVYTHRRVAELDFDGARVIAEHFDKPWFLAYPNDDHLIEPFIYEELAGVMGGGQEGQGHVVVFDKGGHNIQKSQSHAIVQNLLEFYEKHWRENE
ncbi:hypothetical protein TrLO_g4922 [Triparma laevis f. longispina]|uniref:AB hydrolase-1 domain-containing protein n=1 Tax=Triparma laevis f. longispina TaxID=1714387 RepID=A0A9W7C944_9STRA|nr:hypothetical protein TrLO_g4922 [Triparma laevis f. longispina]